MSTDKILINVPTFNRKKIAELSLAQIYKYKTENCFVQIYNDHSTEYDNDWLTPWADEVIKHPKQLGVHHLRWHQFREFIKTDYNFLYLTDNDTLHDPDYVKRMMELYHKYKTADGRKLPVTLYNTKHHFFATIKETEDMIIRKTAPGVSMLLDRGMVETIVDWIDKNTVFDYAWDFRIIEMLHLPWITSNISYLEHYGADGINNKTYDADTAHNPSDYLKSTRPIIMDYLINNKEFDKSILNPVITLKENSGI
jgi:hypothetical protein